MTFLTWTLTAVAIGVAGVKVSTGAGTQLTMYDCLGRGTAILRAGG